jgi:hypothetical protein
VAALEQSTPAAAAAAEQEQQQSSVLQHVLKLTAEWNRE